MSLAPKTTSLVFSSIRLGYKNKQRVVRVRYSRNSAQLLNALTRLGIIQTYIIQPVVNSVKTITAQRKPFYLARQATTTHGAQNALKLLRLPQTSHKTPLRINRASAILEFRIFLKYSNGLPAISHIKNYWKSHKIAIPHRSLSGVATSKTRSMLLLYTTKGLLTSEECAGLGIGGVLVCKVAL